MDNQVIDADNNIASLLQSAREYIKKGDFEKAKTIIEKTLSIDFNDSLIIAALKYVNFWIERKIRFQNVAGHYERGIFLFKQWKSFYFFYEKLPAQDELTLYSLRYWVFNQALYHFGEILDSSADDPELIIKTGLCHKNLGDYFKALEYLESVVQHRLDDSELLAEIADCYAFVNEVRASKVFFREAFFIDPQRIDLNSLESLLIKKLVERIKGHGFNEIELKEWIPVYGVIYGVFSIKRELKPLELGKLKQSITALEHQYEEDQENRHITAPRLLNRYLWLIDYYINAQDSKDRIEDILKKINKLNPSVYELYTN